MLGAEGRGLLGPMFFAGIGLAGGCASTPVEARSFAIVEGGRPACTIVVPSRPDAVAWFAAGELREHVKRITGAELPLVKDDQPVTGRRILVGHSPAVARAGLATEFKWQEYLVRVTPDVVMLVGSDDLSLPPADALPTLKIPGDGHAPQGTCYAVYDFLEKHLGVRWYAPGEDGTSLPPSRTDLSVRCGETRRVPAIPERRPPFGVNFNAWGEPPPSREEIALFQFRNKLSSAAIICHAYEGWPERFLRTDSPHFEGHHPEYFSKDQGEAQLCFTNPAVMAQVVKDAREYFDGKGAKHRANIGSDWFGLEPRDTAVACTCDGCRPLLKKAEGFNSDGASELVWGFVDKVAREVKKTHPGKYVGCLAYFNHAGCPKDLDLADNVYVGPALFTRSWPADGGWDLRMYRDWVAKCPGRIASVWLYPCFPLETATTQGYKSFPTFEAHKLNEHMRVFAKDRVKSFMFCGCYDTPLDFWCAGKYMDDPFVDVDSLIDEFFPRYFGAAAAPMKALYLDMEKTYWDYSNYPGGAPCGDEATSWDRLGTAERMARWKALMDEAVALAGTPAEKKKVATFRDNIWKWMVEGKATWERRKRYAGEVERLKGLPPPSARAARTPAPAGGDPDRADWSKVPALRIDHDVAGYGTEDRYAELRVAHDGQRLLIQIVDRLDTAGLAGDGFWGDRWEIFLSTQREKPYRQIGLNPDGRSHPWTSMEEIWKPGLQYRSHVGEGAWTLNLSLPLADVSAVKDVKPGDTIYLNFIRGVRQGGGDVLAWSPTFNPGRYHNLPRMAEFALDR